MRTIPFSYEGKEYTAEVVVTRAEPEDVNLRADLSVALLVGSRAEDDPRATSVIWPPVLRIPKKGPTAADQQEEASLGMDLLDSPLEDILEDLYTEDARETLAPVFREFWKQTVEEIRDVARSCRIGFALGNLGDGPRYEIQLTASDVTRYDARWIEGTLTQELLQADPFCPSPRVLGRMVSHVSVPASPDIADTTAHLSEAEIGYDILLALMFGAKGADHESLEIRVPPCMGGLCYEIGRAMYETMWAGLPEGE